MKTLIAFLAFYCTVCGFARAAELSRESATAALKKAATFFREKVAVNGGYVYRYSEDLSLREGEGEVNAQTAWVQPPGTPAVGMAFLAAYDATGDSYYLDAARETAGALLKGQLHSGAWTNSIYFDAAERKGFNYRVDPPRERAKNNSTLDDDISQSALTFLMTLDKTLEFKDSKIHEATLFGLESVLKAQCPNGAWTQVFTKAADVNATVAKAELPADWKSLPKIKNYWLHYTLNDNVHENTLELCLTAFHTYGEKKFFDAAVKAGDFILLAQLPEPQPAWAQQYDLQMRPAWARKFEPPAVSAGETQGILRALMRIYRATGDAKYLSPIPAALAWLKRSELKDGRLARFYELNTNKPLYFNKSYEVTYDDSDMPTHYGFKVSSEVEALTKEFEALKNSPPEKPKRDATAEIPKLTERVTKEALAALNSMDEHGRWLDDGPFKYVKQKYAGRLIESRTFIANMRALSKYLRASK